MADSTRLVRGPTGVVVRPMVLDQVGGWLALMADSTRTATTGRGGSGRLGSRSKVSTTGSDLRVEADSTRYARGAPPIHTATPLPSQWSATR